MAKQQAEPKTAAAPEPADPARPVERVVMPAAVAPHTPSRQHIRIECLRLAVETRQHRTHENEFIERAKKFEAYVNGADDEE